MNYIREINSFYDWLETNSVSDSAITLWHALMHINNKAGWKVEFTVASSVLCLKSGLSQSSFKRARNILKQSGRIEWRERKGNQSAIYNLISFAVQYDPQTAPQSEPQSDPQTAPQSEPINKLNLNKTKPSFKKEAKEENISDQVFDEFFPADKDPDEEKEKSCAKKESQDPEPEPVKIFFFKKAMIDYGFEKELTDHFMEVRKKKRLVNTELAFNGFIKEIEKTGKDINVVLDVIAKKQWGGFEAKWLNNLDDERFTNNTNNRNNTSGKNGGKVDGTSELLSGNVRYFEST